jgi:hypothetical protein
MARIPEHPIDGAATWLGTDLQAHPEQWMYSITETDAAELIGAVEVVKKRGTPLERISPRGFPLPTFGPKLQRFVRQIADAWGFVLLRGFPVDGLNLEEIRAMYFGALTHMGVPVAQSVRNELLTSVRAEGDGARARRPYQTNMYLDYHSDMADLVGLLCINPAKTGGISRIMSASAVHNIVQRERPDLLSVLYEEPYYYSWQNEQSADQPPYYWAHIFSWFQERLDTRLAVTAIRAAQEKVPECPRMTEDQGKALEFVLQVQRDHESELVLDMSFQPGDVQVLDNSKVWHGRTAYEDFEEPDRRRHLLRVWLNYVPERPLAPDFWNRYELVGQSTVSPKRRIYDVEVFDTW